MKGLNKFIAECGSVYSAAKKLEKPITTVHAWVKSEKRHFVKKIDGKLIVLGEK